VKPRFAALLVIGGLSCRLESLPPEVVVVTVEPQQGASFTALGGTHDFTARVSNPQGEALYHPVNWDVIPPTASITVTDTGLGQPIRGFARLSVAESAAPGIYRIRASAQGVSDTVTVTVLARPTGKLVFASRIAPVVSAQIFVRDFATDDDPASIHTTTGGIAGLAVDPATATVFFSAGALPDADVFRMNMDGSGVVNLTNEATAPHQGVTFDPVSGDLFFSRREIGGTVTQIFRMQPDGTGLAQITTGTQNKSLPSVSPNGQSLTYSEAFAPAGDLELMISTIAGASPARLTNRSGIDGPASWLTNTRIIWAAASSGGFSDIHAADVPGAANFENVTDNAGASSQPSAGCAANTFTMIRRRFGEVPNATGAYQLDLLQSLSRDCAS
jgi:hypothetical protein